MTSLLRPMRGPVLTCAVVLAAAACNMDVTNPSVIDAGKFDPTKDGQTLSLSAQTNLYIAYQNVAVYGGLIAEELWTGAVRLQTNRLSARSFSSTDDINTDFFALLSLAIASNENAVTALEAGANAGSDANLARASMNAGFALELMAETMCSGVVQGGPELSDAQLLDSAIARFTTAVTVGTAAGATDIVNASNVGLARAYLQAGQYANAATAAGLVPPSFVANVVTSANSSTLATLSNQFHLLTISGNLVAPVRYRVGDARVPVDSTQVATQSTLNGLPYIVQGKYTSYADPIRLASGLEARYIAAEAALHQDGSTTAALALIDERRGVGGQGAYSGATDTLSVMAELLNQRARDFWLEGKKLGDLRRNPSVPLTAVLADPAGAPFYRPAGAPSFGSTLCVPIPPEETNANPNFSIAAR